MKKKWFTLIETVIVLAIISFLLGMTMYFGSQRIQKLNLLTFKQQFIEKYQGLYMNSLSSSYIDWKKYDKINVHLWTWLYYMVGEKKTDLLDFSEFYYSGMQIDGKSVKELQISFAPYKIKCDISSSLWSWKEAKFRILHKFENKIRCFGISNTNCKLIESTCE